MDTKINGYEPTPSELKIVEVLCDPRNVDKNITEICNLAGVSRKTYYSLMKKPEFVKYKNDMILEMLNGKIGDVLNATYKFAVNNSKCSQDRKILLTMAGIYKEKQEIENTNLNLNKDVSSMTDDEIDKELEKYKK